MYPIVAVPDDAADLLEQLGTKLKFWFKHTDGSQYLYKEVRQDTGEDWAEKTASESCGLLDLPHATYDLATWKGKKGVVTPLFVPDRGRLVHGNELLVKILPDYPMGTKSFRTREHTIRLVLAVLKGPIEVPLGWLPVPRIIDTGVKVFVGYLMLDAWIGNTDRHHENWSLILTATQSIHLAPTYDHGSSLGRNESDSNRTSRLTTSDVGWSIKRYVERTSSGFYGPAGRATSPMQAFEEAAKSFPRAAHAWLQRLENVTDTDTAFILNSIPKERISQAAIDFALEMMRLNKERLMRLKGSLE